jgi:hypothetical protein
MSDIELTTKTSVYHRGETSFPWKTRVTVMCEDPRYFAEDTQISSTQIGARYWARKQGRKMRRIARRNLTNPYPHIKKTKISR